jgi:dipeptidyl aminopeptidase/acylaminoacyl peptidase
MLIAGPPVKPELISKRRNEVVNVQVKDNGTELVYEIVHRDIRLIKRLRFSKGETDTIEPEDRPLRDLSWSHHRFRPLINVLTDSGRWALWLGGKEPASPSAASDMHGVVSPNRKWMAFCSGRTGSGDIYLVHAKKKQQSPRRITRSPQPELFPRWSPSGEHLIFLRAESQGRSLLLLMGVTSGSVQEKVLADHREGVLSASWRPDSKAVAFFGRDWGVGTSLYVVDTEFGAVRKVLANVLPGRRGPAWLKDNKGGYILLAITTGDQLVSVSQDGDVQTINTGLLGHGEVTAAVVRKNRTVFVTALGRKRHEDANLRYRMLYRFQLD